MSFQVFMVLFSVADLERSDDVGSFDRQTDKSYAPAVWILLVYTLLTASLALSVFYDLRKGCNVMLPVTLIVEVLRFLTICLVFFLSFTYDGREILYGYQLIFSIVFYVVQ